MDANNNCVECENSYYLIFGKCTRGTISNCIQYDPQSTDQYCTKCAENYRPALNKKTCILGNLLYCQFFKDSTETSCE